MKTWKQNKSTRSWGNCTKEAELPRQGDRLSGIPGCSVGRVSTGCACTHKLTLPTLGAAVFQNVDIFAKCLQPWESTQPFASTQRFAAWDSHGPGDEGSWAGEGLWGSGLVLASSLSTPPVFSSALVHGVLLPTCLRDAFPYMEDLEVLLAVPRCRV